MYRNLITKYDGSCADCGSELPAGSAELAGPSWELFKKEREARIQLPEHVTLCEVCGLVPQDLSIPKWCYRLIGDCTCEDEQDAST